MQLQKYVVKNFEGERVVYIPHQVKIKFDPWGYAAYCLVELEILCFLAYNLVNIWAYLPSNL